MAIRIVLAFLAAIVASVVACNERPHGEESGREILVRVNSQPSDTVPMFAFAIDVAAIAAGFRPLRATPLALGEREIRVWSGFGLGMPNTLYQLRTSGARVRGAMILFWAHVNEWDPADSPESMHGYVRRVYGCGRIRSQEWVEVCEADLSRARPDWGRVLAQIDSLGVGTLVTGAANPSVMDGFHMVVETREGSRYRTSYFAMPSVDGPEDTPRASAILDVLTRIRNASVRDSTLKRR